MEITDIEAKEATIKLTEPLRVTFGDITEVKTVFIQIKTDAGLIGYGEACPFEPVTGETIDSELAALNFLQPILYKQDPTQIEKLHHLMDDQIVGHTALKAGIDLALYDLLGKAANLPVYKLLGGSDNKVITDITISINPIEKMVNDAQKYTNAGFSELKIKAGLEAKHDVAAISAILDVINDNSVLKLDANQGWTLKRAISFMNKFNDSKLVMLEQPLPYTNQTDNALIRSNISQDLILDESVHSAKDAFHVLQNGAADVVNIKLMKSDGLFGAEAINRVAESAGAECMIGCMAETRLGIAAAVHFAAAHQNVHYCDLDSFMMYDEPDWLSGGFTQKGEELTLTDAPGLGIELKF